MLSRYEIESEVHKFQRHEKKKIFYENNWLFTDYASQNTGSDVAEQVKKAEEELGCL
jgi:hypothetical protein